MKASYSPYNKTYHYICLQNQLAHIKNKSSVKSLTKTNISTISKVDGEHSQSGMKNISISLIDPPKSLKLREYYSRRIMRWQNQQNERLAQKLCNISCNVIKKQLTQKQFTRHLSYKKIATKYDDHGKPKNALRLSQSTIASQIQRLGSPSSFCTLGGSRKSLGSQQNKVKRKKVIHLY